MRLLENWSKSMILCHRGLWKHQNEQNSALSFKLAAKSGFGIELDIRDYQGQLVVSHDVPNGQNQTVESVLEDLAKLNFQGCLALNVKSDGLVDLVKELEHLSDIQHFFFDMSIPETRHYISAGLPSALRLSELESLEAVNMLQDKEATYWLDSFFEDWWLALDWDEAFSEGATVFVVSPELHRRNPKDVWMKVAKWIDEGRDVGICTDFPEDFLELQVSREW